MECIKQTLAGKAQGQLKLWINVHYVSGFYSRPRKHYLSYHKNQFPDVTFLLLKNRWSKCVFFLILIQSFKGEDSFLENI